MAAIQVQDLNIHALSVFNVANHLEAMTSFGSTDIYTVQKIATGLIVKLGDLALLASCSIDLSPSCIEVLSDLKGALGVSSCFMTVYLGGESVRLLVAFFIDGHDCALKTLKTVSELGRQALTAIQYVSKVGFFSITPVKKYFRITKLVLMMTRLVSSITESLTAEFNIEGFWKKGRVFVSLQKENAGLSLKKAQELVDFAEVEGEIRPVCVSDWSCDLGGNLASWLFVSKVALFALEHDQLHYNLSLSSQILSLVYAASMLTVELIGLLLPELILVESALSVIEMVSIVSGAGSVLAAAGSLYAGKLGEVYAGIVCGLVKSVDDDELELVASRYSYSDQSAFFRDLSGLLEAEAKL